MKTFIGDGGVSNVMSPPANSNIGKKVAVECDEYWDHRGYLNISVENFWLVG